MNEAFSFQADYIFIFVQKVSYFIQYFLTVMPNLVQIDPSVQTKVLQLIELHQLVKFVFLHYAFFLFTIISINFKSALSMLYDQSIFQLIHFDVSQV